MALRGGSLILKVCCFNDHLPRLLSQTTCLCWALLTVANDPVQLEELGWWAADSVTTLTWIRRTVCHPMTFSATDETAPDFSSWLLSRLGWLIG